MVTIRRAWLAVVLIALAIPPPPALAAGDGVRIAVLDSGILPTHAEFAPGQVVAWRDFVRFQPAPYDDHGHGTATASRAAGATIGPCPGCKLIIGKVINSQNSATWANVAAGIRWATDQGADVISVSIWAADANPTSHVALASAIDYAYDHGALVVWIAGNGGSPDLLETTPSTVLPGAASPQALIVGAASQTGAVPTWSQRDPELVAPGWDVPIAWRDGGYSISSGTSYAAPWVAGATAKLLQQGAPRDPDWLKWVLLHVALDRDEYTYLDEGYGFFGTAALEAARAVAKGDAAEPLPDARDAFHVATAAPRVAQSAQAPAGLAPPLP